VGVTLKLVAVIVPLGLDTLGVAVALGIAGLPAQRRTQVALLFAAFEAAMPLIGVGLGAPLGKTVGGAADYIAAGLLVALGIYMIREDADDDDGTRLLSMTQRGLYPALALGLSISMDELAIGFSAGLLRLPLLPLVIAVGAQAFVLAEIGVRLGEGVGSRWAEAVPRIAAVALIALGAILLIERLTS
jgi:putative Mn2+ efflux pump MntP